MALIVYSNSQNGAQSSMSSLPLIVLIATQEPMSPLPLIVFIATQEPMSSLPLMVLMDPQEPYTLEEIHCPTDAKTIMKHYIIIYPFQLSCKTFLLSLLWPNEVNLIGLGLV